MFTDKSGAGREAGDNFDGKEKGDGLHHHEIHEDEGGGFHSVHTHPDGHKEHDDHATYDEARQSMDEAFDQGEKEERDEDEGREDGGDMSPDDIAGAYGRKASC